MFKLEDGTIVQLGNMCTTYYDEELGSWYMSMLDGTCRKITEEDYQTLCQYVTYAANFISKLS